MAAQTRERLVEAAAKRFYRDGFRNVGIDQVLSDVGISKTAFYKHFESKDDLVLAALESKNLQLQDVIRAKVRERGDPSPLGRLRALLDVVDQYVSSDDFRGCFFVNVVMEFPLAHDPAHQAAVRNKQAIEDIVRELAAEAGAADPRAMARELCLVMEGAYVTRQVTGNKDTIAVVRRLADLIFAAHGCR